MISKRTASLANSFASTVLMVMSNFALADAPFDPTFAGGGLLPYSYWFHPDFATTSGIALDSGGRLLVATSVGNHSTGKFSLGATRHLGGIGESLVFFPPFVDGLPDGTFGDDGIASTFFNPDSNSFATSIAVDSHDHIIIGGSAEGIATCPDGSMTAVDADVLVRLRDDTGFDGQADLSFGTFGAAVYGDCSHYTQGIAAIAIDANDNVVAVGTGKSASLYAVNLIRWTSEGTLDRSFGSSGVTAATFEDSTTIGNALAIDTEGRILVAGTATKTDGTIIGLLSRYGTDGTVDTSFGVHGFAELGSIGRSELGYLGYVCCVAIDSKNRVIAAGTRVFSVGPEAVEQSAFAFRVTAAGLPDSTFGTRGYVYFSTDEMKYANVLAIDNRDRPIIGGGVPSTYYPIGATALIHLNLDGVVNSAIGFGGTYTATFGYETPYLTSLLIDRQGRATLTANGYDSDGRSSVPVLIRYDELFRDGLD
jgi:uncharacterized delta-60 repeat protein